MARLSPISAGILVVIPTYNEVENLARIVTRVRASVPGPTSWSLTTTAPTELPGSPTNGCHR